MKNKLEILVGISGSGKSTYAQKEWAKDPKNTVIINRDKIRELLFGFTESTMKDYYTRKDVRGLENQVTDYANELILVSLSKNKRVIVDNTHLKISYIEEYVRFNTPISITVFYEDPEECKKRDALRTRQVGFNVISKQAKQFENIVRDLNIKIKFPKKTCLSLPNYSFKTKRNKYVPVEGRPSCVIVDVDGTIADNQGKRSPYDWNKVDQDVVKDNIANIVAALHDSGYKIIICTGRDGVAKELTEKWLFFNKIPYHELYIRKEGDMRKDYVVKEEMWNEITKTHNVEVMIDDRRQVIDHARSLGYTVLDVANHSF